MLQMSDYSSIPPLLSVIGGILIIKSKKLKTKEKWANRWLMRDRETDFLIPCSSRVIVEIIRVWTILLGRLESSFRFLRNLVDAKDHIEKHFAGKPERFWKDGILKLREKWRNGKKSQLRNSINVYGIEM